MKQNKRMMDRAARKIERERGKLELSEKKQIKEIQKLAKAGQHVSYYVNEGISMKYSPIWNFKELFQSFQSIFSNSILNHCFSKQQKSCQKMWFAYVIRFLSTIWWTLNWRLWLWRWQQWHPTRRLSRDSREVPKFSSRWTKIWTFKAYKQSSRISKRKVWRLSSIKMS